MSFVATDQGVQTVESFVGLDVSLDETHICVIDEGGRILKETRAVSEPKAIARAIRHKGRRIEHVGLEAGNLSQWLHDGLVREGFSVSVMEARHVRAAFAAMRVKTDRHDARGIAQLIRLGWFKRVHVKSLDAQETRALLTARAFLLEKVTATENSRRAALKNFGLKMGTVTRNRWEGRARELADGNRVPRASLGSGSISNPTLPRNPMATESYTTPWDVIAGGDGVAVASGAETFSEPAHQVELVSTHGAGDCFIGTLVAARAAGADLRQSVAAANRAAAAHVSRRSPSVD